MNAGGGLIEPDPVLGHAANFLYMLTGRAAERARDAGVRRRADPARRSRAQRVDVRGARRRRDAHRHPFGDRRGDRRAEGSAARRRERRRDAAAARDRPGRAAREGRRGRSARKLARKEKIPGLRPSRVPHRGSARDAPAADVARSRPARRTADLVRDVAADRGAREGREEAEPERRLLFGVHLLRARHSTSICSRRFSR